MRKKIQSAEMFVEKSLKLSTQDEDALKMSGISKPHENDVLMGRGGKNNQHIGNEKLRDLARERCEEYCSAAKKGKSEISRELVRLVRKMKPPGRFLRKDPETCKWEDVGDDIAREKASQVLRDAVSLLNGPPTIHIEMQNDTRAQSRTGSAKLSRRRRSPSPYSDDQAMSYPLSTTSSHHSPQPQTSTDAFQSGSHRGRFLVYRPYANYSVRPIGNEAGPPSIPHYGASSTPYRPPVTPASATAARKRQRYYESPTPDVYDYSGAQQHNHIHVMRNPHTPPMATLTPVQSSNIFSRATINPYYSNGSSGQTMMPMNHSTPTTVSTPSYHQNNNGYQFPPPSAPQRNEPWVPDVPPFATSIREYDLFNEELLSDSEREGATSPLPWNPN